MNLFDVKVHRYTTKTYKYLQFSILGFKYRRSNKLLIIFVGIYSLLLLLLLNDYLHFNK